MELAYESYMGAALQYSLAVKASTDDSAREQYNRRLSSAVQRAQQVRAVHVVAQRGSITCAAT